ncbi:polymer-forming cytoskeletal protein [Bacillus sp. 03113]|uniref:polymer-forming cytoskeletal protein n=1 Tax=Bacillus sp. 03113 TaxID=2578211 RepID=UPI00215C01A7|nr:polymer-forming cytoskeletal protein [Bacillus sp. 03113]
MDQMKNLMINGFGSSNGGEFYQVTINGKGTINGDLKCHDFGCNGTGLVNGDIKADKAKISGNVKVTGNVHHSELIVEGRASVTGDANTTNLRISGKASFGGSVMGEEVRVQGKVVTGGNLEAENFYVEGQFTVGGLLNADQIEIDLYGESKAKEIGGQTIKVKQKGNGFFDLFKSVFQARLESELIEGDYIEIVNTKAKIVRGNHVVIGKNCEIELVEYKEIFKQDKNSSVKKHIQI